MVANGWDLEVKQPAVSASRPYICQNRAPCRAPSCELILMKLGRYMYVIDIYMRTNFGELGWAWRGRVGLSLLKPALNLQQRKSNALYCTFLRSV